MQKGSDIDQNLQVRGQTTETLPGGRQTGPREDFDDIVRDDNYEVADSHLNQKGDYTIVFRHKYGGNDQTFPNVSREKIENSRLKDRILKGGSKNL
ncbi:hypothetical protein FDP41_007267 [Naegleria fowleri]|uniref:Uncharacterized protein n=1 Tax=Naegleria fowleri TaxID=5763 RepID=A0A6A5BIP8_NAEFO|nr:uncharacterized protein FDP41_007267 [Naegleria fowleri]KAF0973880.1 hypothetical protein FDP41_007267 [Naegleria fowleri]CAG4708698.1 unnamed protein product [Naegleria fowleri]